MAETPRPIRSDDDLNPHPLSNDLTEQPVIHQTSGTASESRTMPDRPVRAHLRHRTQGDKVLSRAEAGVGRILIKYVAFVLAAGLILSAIVFRQWWLIGVGALVLIPYMFLILAPMWLADTTKEAQDETVRQQRHGVGR